MTVGQAALLRVANKSNTSAKHQYNQRLRHSFQKRYTTYQGIKTCQTFCVHRDEDTGEVDLEIAPGEHATIHGLNCCRNRFCTNPGCSRRREMDARSDSERLISHFLETGTVVFLTLTVSNKGIAPKAQIKAMSDAWKGSMTGSTRKKLERDYGCVGYIRVMETTIHTGDGHLHPHYHVAYCCDRFLSDDEVDSMGSYLLSRWSKGAQKHQLVTSSRGQDYKRAFSDDLGAYLWKLGASSGSDLASELHLQRHKSGDRYGNRSVSWWYLLALAQEAEEEGREEELHRLIGYYQSFERALKGQRIYALSARLKELLSTFPEEELEKDDASPIDAEQAPTEVITLPSHVVRVLLSSPLYAHVCLAVTHSEEAREALRKLCIEERGRRVLYRCSTDLALRRRFGEIASWYESGR